MQSNDFRANVYQSSNPIVKPINPRFAGFTKNRDELYEQYIAKRIEGVMTYIPDDVRNHPRFGLMTEDELKQAVRESYEREQEKHDLFKREYLGVWVTEDDVKQKEAEVHRALFGVQPPNNENAWAEIKPISADDFEQYTKD